MDAGDLLSINMKSGGLGDKLRRLADAIDCRSSEEEATFAVIVLHQHDGLSRTYCFDCGAHEAIGALEVGKHILLNAVMPLGNSTEGG